jgi:hypothetical protein
MTVDQIAHRLVELCKAGDYATCYKELYSPEVESIEPEKALMPYVKGLDGIAEKGKIWNENMEAFHDSAISDPIVCGNHFSCAMMVDYTMKGIGRQKMEEICVYEVQNDKIIKETFFY